MKKIVCVLLVIAVIVSLCPAALADDDVEALKKQIEELKAEIEKKDAIIAEKDAIISALASSVGSSYTAQEQPFQTSMGYNTKVEDDYFIFSDAKFIPAGKKDLFFLDYKLECLYPTTLDTEYPQIFQIKYQFLDEDGIAVRGDQIALYYLSYGDKAWASSFPQAKTTDKYLTPEEIKEYKAVKFEGYEPVNLNTMWPAFISFRSPIVLEILPLE